MPPAMRRSTSPGPARAARAIQAGLTGMPRLLGILITSVTPKKVIARMPVTPSHRNRSGRVNGGAIMAFADVLGAAGTIVNLPPGFRTTTLESKTNFFAAGRGPALTGVAVPLHIGRTTMVWQTTVTNPDGRKVAIVTQTQMVLPAAGGAAAGPEHPAKRRRRRRARSP